jgi:hypothetical protein
MKPERATMIKQRDLFKRGREDQIYLIELIILFSSDHVCSEAREPGQGRGHKGVQCLYAFSPLLQEELPAKKLKRAE